jgi:hypothetical protein
MVHGPVSRIHDILERIRIREPNLWLTNPDSDPTPDPAPDAGIFVSDLQDDKQIVFSQIFCLLLFEATFTSFFKDKKS